MGCVETGDGAHRQPASRARRIPCGTQHRFPFVWQLGTACAAQVFVDLGGQTPRRRPGRSRRRRRHRRDTNHGWEMQDNGTWGVSATVGLKRSTTAPESAAMSRFQLTSKPTLHSQPARGHRQLPRPPIDDCDECLRLGLVSMLARVRRGDHRAHCPCQPRACYWRRRVFAGINRATSSVSKRMGRCIMPKVGPLTKVSDTPDGRRSYTQSIELPSPGNLMPPARSGIPRSKLVAAAWTSSRPP